MVYVSLGRKKSATFLMILRKIYKKGEKVRIFKCYTSSPYFYGWVGNIISCIELNHLAIIKARNADDAISCSI